ncbi:MAG: lectin like domain-containing protein [bacterium]
MGNAQTSPGILAVFSILILLPACGEDLPQLEPPNPAFTRFVEGGSLQRRSTESGFALGYIPSPIRPERHLFEREASASDPEYDMRDPNGDGNTSDGLLTPVRDQGGCGSCWAFASYGALESQLKQSWALALDFSEDNLKHLNGFDSGPCDGGNIDFSTAYLSRYDGPISEADDPYDDSAESEYCTGCAPVRYADSVVFLPTRAAVTDNAYIKQAVLEHGGLYASLYMDSPFYNDSDQTYCYDDPNDSYADSNHAVVIVGWDDDKYVGQAPPGGRYGAFIVRNSWSASWGEGGYFYVSYYDESIAFSSLAHFEDRAESDLAVDTAYTYDTLGWTGSIGYGDTVAWGANWFVPEQDEELAGVGFYATDSPTDYEVYVYENFDGSTFSDLTATAGGTVAYRGWHTVQLDTPVAVRTGDGFGIAVRFSNSDSTWPLPVEMPFAGYSSASTANPGEGYVSYEGSAWTDVTAISWCTECSVCIKALCRAPVPSIPLPAAEAYGRITGGDLTHVEEVRYSFQGISGQVILRYQAWDVDFAREVEILVNGQSAGFARVTANNSWGPMQSLLLPGGLVNDASENLLTFSNTYNPPKTYLWGVREVSVEAEVIPLPAPEAYGRITGGDQTHVQEVSYGFEGLSGEVELFYRAWDVDYANEVEILVNDHSLGFAPRTLNNSWGMTQSIVAPDEYVNDALANLLTFANTFNPPKTYLWGVKEVMSDAEVVPLPAAGAYGRISGGDHTHVQEVSYSFQGLAGAVTLTYEAWDVDYANEVQILVNGQPAGFAPVTSNNSWGPLRAIVLPDPFVHDASTNLLVFDNTYNPPNTYWWGVRNVAVE